MRALVFEQYAGPLTVRDVPDPTPHPDGVVVRVAASGICRSDWHGWQGHDPDIRLPHVPGHELAGTVVAVGSAVRRWRADDRVTVPFVNACGRCRTCIRGDQQVCEDQRQPGFTHWGSFAELVALHAADTNLVGLPDDLPFATAAILGCRYGTAYRAIVQQGKVQPGDWVVVHGCGGLGLSAVQIAVAHGARVIAVDLADGALRLATELGAEHAVSEDVVAQVLDLTEGGADLSLDALGSEQTCANSIRCLRARGRHVQVGLLPQDPVVPLGRALALELELIGSHGLAAHSYPELLALVTSGRLQPERLITQQVELGDAGRALAEVGREPGIAVVTSFA